MTPLQITTRRHVDAVGLLGAYALWGSMLLCGWAQSGSLSDALPGPYRTVLASTMLIAALVALAGVWARSLDLGFLLEAGGRAALGVANIVLATAVFTSSGSVVGTGILCSFIAGTAFLRVWQIGREWNRVQRAATDPQVADSPPPAEPGGA